LGSGFNLWTSAHGFHHVELTKSYSWRTFWTIVVLICSVALLACVVYYFYYVFAMGIYSRFLLESPPSVPWPTTIICDRQVSPCADPTKHDFSNFTRICQFSYKYV
jgi:hypothetical protein